MLRVRTTCWAHRGVSKGCSQLIEDNVHKVLRAFSCPQCVESVANAHNIYALRGFISITKRIRVSVITYTSYQTARAVIYLEPTLSVITVRSADSTHYTRLLRVLSLKECALSNKALSCARGFIRVVFEYSYSQNLAMPFNKTI